MMGGHGRLLLWKRYEAQNNWIEDFGSRWATNGWSSRGACFNIIWRANEVSGYHPRKITNAPRDIWTTKSSFEASFWEATHKPTHNILSTGQKARFVTMEELEPCWMHTLSPLHIASRANRHIDICFGWRDGDGPSVTGGIDRQIVTFDIISIGKVIPVPILLHVSYFIISVTTLWDMIIGLWMCKGSTCHVKMPQFKSRYKTTNELDIFWPMGVKREREN